jgi:hypothetical protein
MMQVGQLDTSEVNLSLLRTNLEVAERLAECSVDAEAVRYIDTARGILSLRTALVGRDWDAIAAWMDDYDSKSFCRDIEEEVGGSTAKGGGERF